MILRTVLLAVLLVRSVSALDEAALSFCRTTNATELPWDDSRPQEGLQLLEKALQLNCGYEEYSEPHRHVFFYKTHKTASGTLLRIFAFKGVSMNVTYASKVLDRGSKFFVTARCPERLRSWATENRGCLDMAFRHVFRKDSWWNAEDCSVHKGRWLLEVYDIWREFFAEDVAVVIPTRAPRPHLKSALSYYEISPKDFLRHKALWNPLAQDLRLFSEEDIEVLSSTFKEHGQQHGFAAASGLHVLVLERIYESLVVMRHRLRWDFRDMLTVSVVHQGDRSAHPAEQGRAEVDMHDETTLNLDKLAYQRLDEHMQYSYEALQKQMSKAALEEEEAALARITHNVNKLAAPLFVDEDAQEMLGSLDLPILLKLCGDVSEDGTRREFLDARAQCTPRQGYDTRER